jgi:hypothetical protein
MSQPRARHHQHHGQAARERATDAATSERGRTTRNPHSVARPPRLAPRPTLPDANPVLPRQPPTDRPHPHHHLNCAMLTHPAGSRIRANPKIQPVVPHTGPLDRKAPRTPPRRSARSRAPLGVWRRPRPATTRATATSRLRTARRRRASAPRCQRPQRHRAIRFPTSRGKTAHRR